MAWSKVFEVSLGALLAFVFGGALQWWLICRQERFQTELLARQLAFMQKLEEDRAAQEAKMEKERAAALANIVGRHNETLNKIAMENRNFESRQRAVDRREARPPTVG